AAEAIGQELAGLIVPEELRAAHREGLRRFLATGEGPLLGRRVELCGQRKGGTRVPVEAAITHIPGHPDRPQFIATLRDLTERKRAEAERQERSQLALLVGAIGVALNEPGSLQSMLQRCTDLLVAHLDAAFARVWTLSEDEETLELQASSGLYTHLDGAHACVPVGQFKIGLIATERKPHLTNEVQGDARAF